MIGRQHSNLVCLIVRQCVDIHLCVTIGVGRWIVYVSSCDDAWTMSYRYVMNSLWQIIFVCMLVHEPWAVCNKLCLGCQACVFGSATVRRSEAVCNDRWMAGETSTSALRG